MRPDAGSQRQIPIGLSRAPQAGNPPPPASRQPRTGVRREGHHNRTDRTGKS
jgi:hypothetical protein